PSVLCVKERSWQRPIPAREHGLPEGTLFAPAFFRWLLPVIWKHRFVPRHEPPHEDQIAVLIQVYPHDLQSLRRILLGQLIQHGIFVATGLAPRRPKRDQQRFPAILLAEFFVSLRVNQLRIARPRRFWGLWTTWRGWQAYSRKHVQQYKTASH